MLNIWKNSILKSSIPSFVIPQYIFFNNGQILLSLLHWGIILKIVFKTFCMQAGSNKSLILHACAFIYIILHSFAFACIRIQLHSSASICIELPIQDKG